MASMQEKIIREAQGLVRRGGLRALTYDALAARLGVSKQAVLYWFPKKPLLLAALAEPAFAAEAEAVEAAVRQAGPGQAVAAAVQGIVEFHLADLDRFRLIYLAPQSGQAGSRVRMPEEVQARIHTQNARMYGAIAAALGPGPETMERAIALHMSALGVVLVHALTEQIGDESYAAIPDMGAVLGGIWTRGNADG